MITDHLNRMTVCTLLFCCCCSGLFFLTPWSCSSVLTDSFYLFSHCCCPVVVVFCWAKSVFSVSSEEHGELHHPILYLNYVPYITHVISIFTIIIFTPPSLPWATISPLGIERQTERLYLPFWIEGLYGSHVGWQEQRIFFCMIPRRDKLYCSYGCCANPLSDGFLQSLRIFLFSKLLLVYFALPSNDWVGLWNSLEPFGFVCCYTFF